MALKEVLKQDKRLFFSDSLEGVREDKTPQIADSILSLKVYKSRELSFLRLYRISASGLSTLIELVNSYVGSMGAKLTIGDLLDRHNYSKGYYHAVYQRLEVLYKNGLVECDKVVRGNLTVSYFYPTKLGIEGVLGLLEK